MISLKAPLSDTLLLFQSMSEGVCVDVCLRTATRRVLQAVQPYQFINGQS